ALRRPLVDERGGSAKVCCQADAGPGARLRHRAADANRATASQRAGISGVGRGRYLNAPPPRLRDETPQARACGSELGCVITCHTKEVFVETRSLRDKSGFENGQTQPGDACEGNVPQGADTSFDPTEIERTSADTSVPSEPPPTPQGIN